MTSSNSRSARAISLEIFFASFLILFQELTLIRWMPGQVRVLAYFPNLILISAFLGLGIGALRTSKQSLLKVWPFTVLLLVLVTIFLSKIAFTQRSDSEHLWLLYFDLPQDATVVTDVRLPIVFAYILSMLSFIPLGQLLASRLHEYQSFGSSLWAYSYDICGSICGVVGFSLLSFFQLFPVIWFGFFLLTALLFFRNDRKVVAAYLVLSVGILLLISGNEKAWKYSPYYAITSSPSSEPGGLQVMTNGSLHQHALNLSRAADIQSPMNVAIREGYHLPYTFFAEKPKRGLIVGAGTGNDVAVMLDEGVESIDAVEIDPVILELGKSKHPNHPYDSPRVRVFNTDARSFLNSTTEKYDIIVFGTLDSMTQLSALSNVRLDNFVYTIECIEAARRHLSAQGGMTMYFMTATSFIHQRMVAMMTQAFGEMPVVISRYYYLFNNVYMAGPAFKDLSLAERQEKAVDYKKSYLMHSELPSDDWPYLYLNERSISFFYLSLIGFFLVFSISAVALASGEMRKSLRGLSGIDWEMSLFGMGFLLLETRSVTEMSLIWGTTWVTSSVVFAAILIMILFSTILNALKPISFQLTFGLLIASLLASYFFPIQFLLGQSSAIKFVLSLLVVGLPIFFAAGCFAITFQTRQRADLALGWNLLGAVVGGLIEFASMLTGFRNLLLCATAIYLCVLLCRSSSQSREREALPLRQADPDEEPAAMFL